MDEGVMLALTQMWWSWDTPAIHKALAASLLCSARLAEEECRAYAAFVLERSPESRAYSRPELERQLQAVPPAVRAAVLRVARALGPALQQADRKLRQREGET